MSIGFSECSHLIVKENFCKKCGVYSETNMKVYGIKDHYLNREGLESHEIIDSFRNNSFDLSRGKDYSRLAQDTLEVFQEINRICSQLNTKLKTKILASYIFWHSQTASLPINQADVLISILIALKYQQALIIVKNHQLVQEKILSVIRLSDQLPQKNIMEQEFEKIQTLNFKLKLTTFVDFLEFYVASGVTFNNENIVNSDYNMLMDFIDWEIQRYIQNGLYFSEPNQQYLALTILYHARQKCCAIVQVWNWHIQNITKTKKHSIDLFIASKKELTALKDYNENLLQSQLSVKSHSPLFYYRNKNGFFRQKPLLLKKNNYSMAKKFKINPNIIILKENQ